MAIIDEAERLSEEAGNALLKLLEEPAKNTIIFLLTEDENALLPTIRSRVSIIYFTLVGQGELESGLKERGYETDKIATVLPLAAGRPGRAISLLENEEALSAWQKEAERWTQLQGQPYSKKLKIVEEIFGSKDDAAAGRERLDGVLEIWQTLSREKLLKQIGGASEHSQSPGTMVELIDTLGEAREQLRRNVHPRLAIENVLMRLN